MKIKIWTAGNPTPIIVDTKKIKCYNCGSTHFQRQGGIEITSEYSENHLMGTNRLNLDTRIFCCDCQEELEFKEDGTIAVPPKEENSQELLDKFKGEKK